MLLLLVFVHVFGFACLLRAFEKSVEWRHARSSVIWLHLQVAMSFDDRMGNSKQSMMRRHLWKGSRWAFGREKRDMSRIDSSSRSRNYHTLAFYWLRIVILWVLGWLPMSSYSFVAPVSASSLGSMSGNHPKSKKSTVNSLRWPVSTVTPSLRRAAACRAAPPGPLPCSLAYTKSLLRSLNRDLPRRYNALGIDYTMPWHISLVEVVINVARSPWEVL